jgi:predicted ATPase
LAAPFRSVITGGPGAGKSTLLAEIASAGIATFPEVARAILQAPDGMAMRAERPADFAAAMLEAELIAWHAAPEGPSLYDRGFPDIAGFLSLEGLRVPEALDRICRDHRYEGPVFHAPPWREIYTPDEERVQDWEQAVASDAAVVAAWKHYGYRLVELPMAPTAERAAFVLRHLTGKAIP